MVLLARCSSILARSGAVRGSAGRTGFLRRSLPRYNLNLHEIHNRWEQYAPNQPEYKWFPGASEGSRKGFMLGALVLIVFGGLLTLNYTRKIQDSNEAKMEVLARKSLSPVLLINF